VTAAGDSPTRVLVVDDQPANVRLLEALLVPRGYDVLTASSGEAALEAVRSSQVDLILLDIVMPGMDGYDVCRRIREDPDTAFLPVVMVTASGEEQKVRSLEAGADDFLTKPIDTSELLARVASLARIKHYQDTIRRQAAELASWNRELESRVESQVAQLERMGNLRRFLSPQVAELVVDAGDGAVLESHRREIVVVFCDLRGFTPFAEASEPEEVMGVLKDYHHALGDLIFRFEGTLERFAGDGLMVFFNDPVPCDDGPSRAIRMSVAMRTRVRRLAETWARQGHDLALGIGIAQGYATLVPSASRDGWTTPRSAASPTSPPACVPTRNPGRYSSPNACSRRPVPWSWDRTKDRATYGASAGGSGPTASAASTPRGRCRDRRRLDTAGGRTRRSVGLGRG